MLAPFDCSQFFSDLAPAPGSDLMRSGAAASLSTSDPRSSEKATGPPLLISRLPCTTSHQALFALNTLVFHGLYVSGFEYSLALPHGENPPFFPLTLAHIRSHVRPLLLSH